MKLTIILLALIVWMCAGQIGWAQYTNDAPGLRADAPSGLSRPGGSEIWENNRIGQGFRQGATHVGLSVEGGFGVKLGGAFEAHDLALERFEIGYMLSDVVAKNHWFRGNWEILGQVFGGMQYDPSLHYVVGVTPVLRYNFITRTRCVPFLDLAAGFAATDIGEPDLGSVFEFNLHGGPGVHYFFNQNTALTLQYKFLHLSNAGTHLPNLGANVNMFSIGLTYFF